MKMNTKMKMKWKLLSLLVLVAVLSVTAVAQDTSAFAANPLAPTGKLRLGVYPGSPTSILPGKTPTETKGVAYDLGRQLAQYFHVPFELVVLPKNADVLAAVKAGTVDIIFTNASPERAREMDFSAPFLRVEQSCLVPPGSKIQRLAEVDVAGNRIAVTVGSSSEKSVGSRLKQAQLVVVPSLDQVLSMLKSGELQAFSTNKAILFEMADRLPGGRVLEGAWGYENFAAAIPKGREKALPLLNQFLSEARKDGRVAEAITRAGLRGTVPPE